MAMKTRSLTLSFPHANNDPNETRPEAHPMYRVEKVINGTEYVPGQYLKKEVVTDLCEDDYLRSWQVTMVPPKDLT